MDEGKPERAYVLSLVHIIILEMSEARQKHASPQALSAVADGISANAIGHAVPHPKPRHTPLMQAIAKGAYIAHRRH